jgi:hypothetical protein
MRIGAVHPTSACFASEDHFGMGSHASGKSFRISNLTILASARDEPLA